MSRLFLIPAILLLLTQAALAEGPADCGGAPDKVDLIHVVYKEPGGPFFFSMFYEFPGKQYEPATFVEGEILPDWPSADRPENGWGNTPLLERGEVMVYNITGLMYQVLNVDEGVLEPRFWVIYVFVARDEDTMLFLPTSEASRDDTGQHPAQGCTFYTLDMFGG